MPDGIFYPLLVSLILFPGWLAYNHPPVFKRFADRIAPWICGACSLIFLLGFGFKEGIRIAKDQVIDDNQLVVQLRGQITEIESRLKFGVIGFCVIVAILTFYYVSVTTWKDSSPK